MATHSYTVRGLLYTHDSRMILGNVVFSTRVPLAFMVLIVYRAIIGLSIKRLVLLLSEDLFVSVDAQGV